MADIFVSYTSSDRDWAFWIAHELEKLAHTPRIHDWEISGGGNIVAWMVERHHQADRVLGVISSEYLTKAYSLWERQAAEWAAASERPDFFLPVFIEACDVPTLLAPRKRCDLYGVTEEEARARLKLFVEPAARPTGTFRFPGVAKAADEPPKAIVAFPGAKLALSNIPITVPRHFLGREDVLADITTALAKDQGRVAITALHGLRGVGKTTLAAAYAERHRADYRATWWIRAQTESTMRADLVALGVRLGWVAADEKEEPAFAVVMERLRNEGEGILLVYDNAINSESLRPYLPRGGVAQVLVTSNAPNWRGVAAPVAIEVWPNDIGADYLIARTGRDDEREAALALSEALGGLPLAHEQAAAYCDRLGVSLAEYHRRFEATPVRLLDDERHAPAEHNYGMTVLKSFELAIEQAGKLHPAAEPLIVYAALLAPEPIPLFLFAEARQKFGEPLASALADEGLDEAVAALRFFALVDRETIPDERDPSITTDCIRLHRLVRQVASVRWNSEAREDARRVLVESLAAVYPDDLLNNSKAWPRARRLDAITLLLVGDDAARPKGADESAAVLLSLLGILRRGPLGDYARARLFLESAVAIRERALGLEHRDTATSLNDLGSLLSLQGDLATAGPVLERSLAIFDKVLGPQHRDTAAASHNLAYVRQAQGDLAGARLLYERALKIFEKVLGSEHPDTAMNIDNLAGLLQAQGDFAGARPLYECALAIREKALGFEHPDTGMSLNNVAFLLATQGNFVEAQPLFERALVVYEKAFGANHPFTNRVRCNLARLLLDLGRASNALALAQISRAAHDNALGFSHPWTKEAARVAADALNALGRGDEASALREKYGVEPTMKGKSRQTKKSLSKRKK